VIDEEGMARTAEKSLRSHSAPITKPRIRHPTHEIFFDPLALPISPIEEDRAMVATITAIRRMRQELPGCHIIWEFPIFLEPCARVVLNLMFLPGDGSWDGCGDRQLVKFSSVAD